MGFCKCRAGDLVIILCSEPSKQYPAASPTCECSFLFGVSLNRSCPAPIATRLKCYPPAKALRNRLHFRLIKKPGLLSMSLPIGIAKASRRVLNSFVAVGLAISPRVYKSSNAVVSNIWSRCIPAGSPHIMVSKPENLASNSLLSISANLFSPMSNVTSSCKICQRPFGIF